MLLQVTIIIFAVALVLKGLLQLMGWKRRLSAPLESLSKFFTVILAADGLVFFVCIAVMVMGNATADYVVALNQQKYKTLTYRAEMAKTAVLVDTETTNSQHSSEFSHDSVTGITLSSRSDAESKQTTTSTRKLVKGDYIRDEVLLSEIYKWNKELAGMQTLQHNYWIGNLIPDIYDQFELIEF